MTPTEVSTTDILRRFRKIAVVGISPNPARPSHYVSAYMQDHGYELAGVNPGQSEILGMNVYPSLADVPGPLEIVAVFRNSEYLSEVADAAIEAGAKVLWIQLDIEDEAAEARAEDAGLIVVRRRCLMVEHQSAGLR